MGWKKATKPQTLLASKIRSVETSQFGDQPLRGRDAYIVRLREKRTEVIAMAGRVRIATDTRLVCFILIPETTHDGKIKSMNGLPALVFAEPMAGIVGSLKGRAAVFKTSTVSMTRGTFPH